MLVGGCVRVTPLPLPRGRLVAVPALRWAGVCLFAAIGLACSALGQSAPSPTASPQPASEPGRAWATFVRDDCEWSDSQPSAACFGSRGPGFRVRAVRAEGSRWYVWDPTTNNYAYVDRDALSLPAELTADQAGTSPPITEAVICLDRSADFRYTAEAQASLADWIKTSARPGNVYYLRWIEENSYRPEAEIAPAIRVPASPTPAPLPQPPGTPNPFSTAQMAAATATTAAIGAAATSDAATRQAITGRDTEILNRQVAAFASASLPPPASGDVSGCVKKASELLDGFDGDRVLLVAAASTRGAPEIPGLRLDRAQVRLVYFQCDQPAECDAARQQWREFAAAANAADIRFSDPSEGLSTIGL